MPPSAWSLIIFLAAALALMLLPIAWQRPVTGSLPQLAVAPGYWQKQEQVGQVRLIPLAGPRLVSPAANAESLD